MLKDPTEAAATHQQLATRGSRRGILLLYLCAFVASLQFIQRLKDAYTYDTTTAKVDTAIKTTSSSLPSDGNGALNETMGSTLLSDGNGTLNEAKKNEAYLSACLLYMDDNHRLPEWLAYHYYNLNLRHVILNIDFRSLTSQPPTEILDRWRPFISSEVWHPKDWLDPSRYNVALQQVKNNITIPNGWQIITQNMFNRRCALHFQSQNRTWVSFTDTDEFWLLNPAKVPDAITRMSRPGSVLTYFTDGQADLASTGTNGAHRLPERYRGPCITTYRILFGAKESTELELRRQVPDWIDPKRFETLRWRYHTPEHKRQNGKTMLDVSRINASVLASPDEFKYPHQLLLLCHETWADADSHLRLHHYLGSWEYFNYKRGDSRWSENRQRYELRQTLLRAPESHASDYIRPWLMGFIRQVGNETARVLLQDQGILQKLGSVPLGILLEGGS